MRLLPEKLLPEKSFAETCLATRFAVKDVVLLEILYFPIYLSEKRLEADVIF